MPCDPFQCDARGASLKIRTVKPLAWSRQTPRPPGVFLTGDGAIRARRMATGIPPVFAVPGRSTNGGIPRVASATASSSSLALKRLLSVSAICSPNSRATLSPTNVSVRLARQRRTVLAVSLCAAQLCGVNVRASLSQWPAPTCLVKEHADAAFILG